jgi:hypothetical protein
MISKFSEKWMKSHEERLLTAAEDGRLSVVKRIISTRKASVNCCDGDVSSLLMILAALEVPRVR